MVSGKYLKVKKNTKQKKNCQIMLVKLVTYLNIQKNISMWKLVFLITYSKFNVIWVKYQIDPYIIRKVSDLPPTNLGYQIGHFQGQIANIQW